MSITEFLEKNKQTNNLKLLIDSQLSTIDIIENSDYVELIMKYALITGVSTGIGYASLKAMINKGYHVYGSVRRPTDADRLSSEFPEHFTPLIFDVTNQESVDLAATQVTKTIGDKGLSCLVNNSGIAIGGPLLHQSIEEFERHFQVNVIGLMRVIQAFLPLLGARKDHPIPPGKIINISSVAGKFAQPFVGAYVSSKHAVEGLSHSLRRELLIYGIKVVIVGPGAVKTPIWDKGINMEPYKDTIYGQILKKFAVVAKKGGEEGLKASYLGSKIADIAVNKKPRLRYAFVPNSLTNWIIPRLLPDRWVDRFVKKQLMR